jgi:hypothetical protein
LRGVDGSRPPSEPPQSPRSVAEALLAEIHPLKRRTVSYANSSPVASARSAQMGLSQARERKPSPVGDMSMT